MNPKIPPQIIKFFWGDNKTKLSFKNNKKYIIQTLLEKGDVNDVKWLFSHLNSLDIKSILPSLKLSNKSANFWKSFFNSKI